MAPALVQFNDPFERSNARRAVGNSRHCSPMPTTPIRLAFATLVSFRSTLYFPKPHKVKILMRHWCNVSTDLRDAHGNGLLGAYQHGSVPSSGIE